MVKPLKRKNPTKTFRNYFKAPKAPAPKLVPIMSGGVGFRALDGSMVRVLDPKSKESVLVARAKLIARNLQFLKGNKF